MSFNSAFDILPNLLNGAWMTLQVTFFAGLLAFVLSFVVAFARMSEIRAIRMASTTYVEIFRGTSALVQLFYLFYILPLAGIKLPALATGVIGLGLNLAAYGSEVVRSAILSIARGQHEAGQALGLTRLQILRKVIVPQAMVMILPAFGNLLVELVKTSSLVSLITLTDLTFAGVQMVLSTGKVIETWGVVLIIYFCIAYPLSLLAGAAEKRAQRFRLGSR